MSLETFSNNLKHLRSERNLTRRDMSNLLSVDVKRYSAWEEGRAYPHTEIMIRLCDLLEYKDIYSLLTMDIRTEVKC